MREDGGDGEATGALDVHEERVGVLHKSLELVRASLLLGGGVKKVDGESLMGEGREKGEKVSNDALCGVRRAQLVSRCSIVALAVIKAGRRVESPSVFDRIDSVGLSDMLKHR